MWLSFIGKVQKERFLISWRELFAWTLSGSSAYHFWSSKGSWWSSQCANYKETTCGSSFITREIWEASTEPKGQKKDSFKAEATGQLTFVTKSNALRKAAKEKTLQLQEVEDKLNGKLEALKGCWNIMLRFFRGLSVLLDLYLSVPYVFIILLM